MNTDTGRIYAPDEFERLSSASRKAGNREQLKREEREFADAMDAGKIVPVSDTVARHVQTGQRVDERRRRRKAAKAARRANR